MKTFTVGAVAEILQVSPATVYALCAQKKLPHLRIGAGRGTIRIRQTDLEDYLATATVDAEANAAPKASPLKLKHLKV